MASQLIRDFWEGRRCGAPSYVEIIENLWSAGVSESKFYSCTSDRLDQQLSVVISGFGIIYLPRKNNSSQALLSPIHLS